MTFWGLIFIFFGGALSRRMSTDLHIAEMTEKCLFITGFIQSAFAASAIFGEALRGAGDTVAVMLLNLTSNVLIRFTGVLVLGWYFKAGLPAIWCVLSGEILFRGVLTYARFLHGGWKHVKV